MYVMAEINERFCSTAITAHFCGLFMTCSRIIKFETINLSRIMFSISLGLFTGCSRNNFQKDKHIWFSIHKICAFPALSQVQLLRAVADFHCYLSAEKEKG